MIKKINKKYLFQYLKLFTSDYKLKDCYFCCHRGYARLATSYGFCPDYYIICEFTSDLDVIEIRVRHNVYDPDIDEYHDTLVGKFGSYTSQLYKAQGWRDLL